MNQDLLRGAVVGAVVLIWAGWTSSWPEVGVDGIERTSTVPATDVREACGPLVQHLAAWDGQSYAEKLGDQVRNTMSGEDVVALCLSLQEADRDAVYDRFEALGLLVP